MLLTVPVFNTFCWRTCTQAQFSFIAYLFSLSRGQRVGFFVFKIQFAFLEYVTELSFEEYFLKHTYTQTKDVLVPLTELGRSPLNGGGTNSQAGSYTVRIEKVG